MKPRIVFTGGGTAGHVTPNVALIAALNQDDWHIAYIGSKGIERTIIRAQNIPYYVVASGKLRRYFSWQNLIDPLKILFGITQAWCLLKKLKTEIVFSKGGFVAFPVVVAAWLQRIPVIAHESDLSVGLANRLSFPFVRKLCVSFAATKQNLQQHHKIIVTGAPVRQELFHGDKAKGLALCGFSGTKPCLLVIGGSQGARLLNQVLRQCLPSLCASYHVIHLCGQGNLDANLHNNVDYYQLEYANEELGDLFAASSMVISRAGANSVYEMLALAKPHVLIPLSVKVSRGDQLHNAQYFASEGVSRVITEEELTAENLLANINALAQDSEQIRAKIKALNINSATEQIVAIIKKEHRNES